MYINVFILHMSINVHMYVYNIYIICIISMHVYLYICQTFNNNTCIICMHMCIDVCMYMCVFYISLSKDWNTERNP